MRGPAEGVCLKMTVKTFANNEMGQNTYLYYDEAAGDAVIIDAGCSAADRDEIARIIKDRNLRVHAILLTHGHFDHILAVPEIRQITPARVCCHESEAPLLENPALNFSAFFGTALSVAPERLLRGGEALDFGGVALKALHTPGHTPGGVCFYDDANGRVFTGDTLFRESIGRTDLPMGNMQDLLGSVEKTLLTLPDRVAVYPGHGLATDIGHERRHNPFTKR